MSNKLASSGDESASLSILASKACSPQRWLAHFSLQREAFHSAMPATPAPLVFRRSTSEWTELVAEDINPEAITDMPLGITVKTMYCQLRVRLEVGDMVLGFSDAVTESQDLRRSATWTEVSCG